MSLLFSHIFIFPSIFSVANAEEPTNETGAENQNEQVGQQQEELLEEVDSKSETYIVDYVNPFQSQQWETTTGKKVFLVEDHRVPIVELHIAIPVGLWHQIDKDLHLEESLSIMTFDPSGILRATSTMLAFDFSISNYDEYSVIKASYLSSDVKDVQEHVLNIFSNESFDEQELKRMQKGQDLSWKGNLKEPSFIGKKEVVQTLFPDENDVRQINYLESDDIVTDGVALRDNQKQIFSVQNIQFGFAGDIDASGAKEWIAQLETIFFSTNDKALKVPPPQFGQTHDLVQNPIDRDIPTPNLNQVYFFFFRDLLPVHSDDYAKYLVSDQVLAGSFYSRLYQALRHEDGDTYGVSSRENWSIDNDGLLSIETFTRADNAAELEEKLRRTIQEFQENGISQDEFDQAVGNIVGRDKRRIQAPTQILGRQIANSIYGRDIDYNDKLVQKVQALTLEEVNAFIKDFYVESKFGMIRVVPEE
jgi:zinc protease